MGKGLYNAEYEHDACGVGMVVNIHGNKSHELVDNALKVLENMRHRGAEGADNKTGDGAGIMLQIPHEFILLQGIPVPEKGKYGTGLVFLPKDAGRSQDILSVMIEEIEREGLSLMHLRNVPTAPECLGESALANELKSVKNFLLLGSEKVTSKETAAYLQSLASARGGSFARLEGPNRYETSMAVAQYAVKNLGFSWDGVAFASGQGPYDSLGGGVVQGKEKSVLLLADATSCKSVNVITKNGGTVDTMLKFFGSTVVVPGDVRAKICSTLHVPYYSNTSFARYGIARSKMAQLQVARNEPNDYGYDDFFTALNPDQYEYGTSAFYQFAKLTDGYSGMSSDAMNAFVANNCSYSESSYGRKSNLRNMGQAFVTAAQETGVNEVYLLAHAIWESGWGCSELAGGWVPDKDGEVIVDGKHYPYKKGQAYYNFYGIGAVDSNALSGGRALAVKEQWTSPELAIRGAAGWISANYLRRSSGAQDSLYLMKWDVIGAVESGSAWHEYCTGLGSWCEGNSSLMNSCNRSAGWPFGNKLSFSVPVYAG